MTDEDQCPHCGSEDYGSLGDHLPSVCLTCAYDTDHGASGVCPGGKHPITEKGRVRNLCCDWCYKRMPTNLPGEPRWRSRLNLVRGWYRNQVPWHYDELVKINAAVLEWLTAHPMEPPNPLTP